MMPLSLQEEFRIGTSLMPLVTALITNGRYVRLLPSRNLAIAEKSASKNVATWAEVWRLLTIRSAMVFRIGVNGRTSSPAEGTDTEAATLSPAASPFPK